MPTDRSLEVAPPIAMLQMIQGFWVSRAICVAAELGLADLIEARARTAEELAEAVKCHPQSVYRMLRALASVDVFAEGEDGRFRMTPLAETLRSDVPGSLRFFAIAELGADHYPAWEALMHSVRTGDVAFEHVFGTDAWSYRAQRPEHGEIFDAAMASFGNAVNTAVLESFDFSPFAKVVDVGGGNGSLLAGLLNAYPGLSGILMDLPHVIEGAQVRMKEEGLSGRCEVVAGDFFSSVPAGGDAYLLKWIIHDWDDRQSIDLFRNCRDAMSDDGRLLVVEAIVPPGNEPSFHKFMDLNMLVMLGERERTEDEYRSLFESAGYRMTRIVPTRTEMNVLEAVPE